MLYWHCHYYTPAAFALLRLPHQFAIPLFIGFIPVLFIWRLPPFSLKTFHHTREFTLYVHADITRSANCFYAGRRRQLYATPLYVVVMFDVTLKRVISRSSRCLREVSYDNALMRDFAQRRTGGVMKMSRCYMSSVFAVHFDFRHTIWRLRLRCREERWSFCVSVNKNIVLRMPIEICYIYCYTVGSFNRRNTRFFYVLSCHAITPDGSRSEFFWGAACTLLL